MKIMKQAVAREYRDIRIFRRGTETASSTGGRASGRNGLQRQWFLHGPLSAAPRLHDPYAIERSSNVTYSLSGMPYGLPFQARSVEDGNAAPVIVEQSQIDPRILLIICRHSNALTARAFENALCEPAKARNYLGMLHGCIAMRTSRAHHGWI
jgi:hypothetical protein